MKTPLKFLVISMFLLGGLAILNSDCPHRGSEVEGIEYVATEQVSSIQIRAEDINSDGKDQGKESRAIFNFPNIFKIFDSIF